MTIRAATAEDLDTLVEMGRRMHQESRFARLVYDGEKVRATLAMLIDSPDGFLWVCERHGWVVGGLAAMAVARWFSPARCCCDLGLFVDADERGGVAAAVLVRRYLEWAQDLGIDPADIELGVNTGVKTKETGALLQRLGASPRGYLYTWETSPCA